MSGLFYLARRTTSRIILLAAVLLISATIAPLSASAAPNTTYDSLRKDQVSKFLLGRALYRCLADHTNDAVLSSKDVTSGDWNLFQDSQTTVGPYRQDNNLQYCGNYNNSGSSSQLVIPTLEGLGINGGEKTVSFLCGLSSVNGVDVKRDSYPVAPGKLPSNKTEKCVSGSGNYTLPATTAWGPFVTSVYANSELGEPQIPLNDLSATQKYQLSVMALVNSCGGKPATGGIGAGSSDQVINVDIVTWEGGKPVVKTVPYSLDKKQSSTINLFAMNNIAHGIYQIKCQDLASSSNNQYSTAKGAQAYADEWQQYVTNNSQSPPPDGTGATSFANTDDGDKNATSCAVDGIGWIICPVMTFMAGIVDAAYGWVSSLLVVKPLETFNGGGSGASSVYSAWSMMRNFANVAFVIAFLIIIYSQVTGIGLGNYGIKKMLPRLIVAAILVNISFWVCALAVDLSNVLGGSLKQLFDVLGGDLKGPAFESTSTSGGGWVGLTVFVLTGAGVLLVGLSVLLPALIAALLAIVTVFMVLTLRQALLILLIVVSPLAFVAYLLPNTESWFTKWRQLFQTLLLMYPIIAVIFGASAFASQIIMNGATEPDGDGKFAVQVMGALITVLPLAITPVVMKTAGGILNRFGGFINNPNKGPFDRMKKGAEGVRNRQNDRRAIRSMNGGRVFGRGRFQRQAKREAVDANLKRERGSLSSQYVAEEAILRDGNGNPITDANGIAQASRYGKQLAGAGPLGMGADATAIQSALANAQFTIDEATAKEIKAESVMVRNMDASALTSILNDSKSSEARQAAAMQRLIKVGDPGDYEGQVNSAINGKSDTLRRATAEALGSDGPGWLKASDIDSMASGRMKAENERAAALGKEQTSLSTIARDNTAAGVISAEKIVGENNASIKYAFDAADDDGKQRLINASVEAQSNDQLKGKIKHNIAAIGALTDATKHISRAAPITRTVPGPNNTTRIMTNSYELKIN